MTPAELAAQRYVAAWFAADRDQRAALLEACFAADGRILVLGDVIRGRDGLAAAIEAFQTDPRKLTGALTSAIETGAATFRFRVRIVFPDGALFIELIDIGEIDGDGRIATLFTFAEPLADLAPADLAAPTGPAAPTGKAGPASPAGSAGSATPAEPAGAPDRAQNDLTSAAGRDATVSPAALAAQRYIDAVAERDPAARQALFSACLADDGRLVGLGRPLRGRAAIAAMIATFVDRRGLRTERTSAIATAGRAFRFASRVTFPDGTAPILSEDCGEIDDEGRITTLYAFPGPLHRLGG